MHIVRSEPGGATSSPPTGHDAREDGTLEEVDLLNDLTSLSAMLRHELDLAVVSSPSQRAHVLDGFLLAAGMCQVAEDYLHRQPGIFDALSRQVQGPALQIVRAVGPRAAAGTSALHQVQDRALRQWHAQLVTIVSELATGVMDHRTDSPRFALGDDWGRQVQRRAHRLVACLPDLPESLRRQVLRLPDSFRTFDQRPEDCDRLAAAFAGRWPDHTVPLVVVGVRTSGSYLAPLQAVALTAIGFHAVDWMTYRPGQALLPGEQQQLDRLREAGGMVLVIDDPPVTGNKLARTAEAFDRLGLPVGLLVPLLGEEESVPVPLRQHAVVALPWSQWAFHDRFTEPALTSTFSDLLVGRRWFLPSVGASMRVTTVHGVDRPDLAPIGDMQARPLTRSHLRGRFQVEVSGDAGRGIIDVYVKGTGLGYFGRNSVAVSRRLGGFVPEVYGWRDGFLFRRALPEQNRVPSGGVLDPPDATSMAAYVAGRAQRLSVPEDMSLRLRKRHPVWELAADALATGFGRAAPLAAPLMRNAAVRILQCPTPSVVDGSAALAHWFRDGEPGSLLKVDYDERAFSVWDQYCYDAVWDLAVAAADHAVRLARGEFEGDDFAELLRAAYQEATGEVVSAERWFLYRTVHLRSLRGHFVRLLRQGVGQLQSHAGSPPARPDGTEDGFDRDLALGIWACDEAMARGRDQYLAAAVLGDAVMAPTGPPCAVTLDGSFGSPAMSGAMLNRAGALALRALLRHGHHPFLVTDASLRRLRQQVNDFGLAGGVGEHATVSYRRSTGQIGASVDGARAAAMTLLPAMFPDGEGLLIAPGFAHTMRVCALDADGHLERPGPIMATWTEVSRRSSSHHVDLVPPDHDETGARAILLRELGDGHAPARVSTPADLDMLLGHHPGTCPVCRPPALLPAADLVLGALDDANGPVIARLAGAVRSLYRWKNWVPQV